MLSHCQSPGDSCPQPTEQLQQRQVPACLLPTSPLQLHFCLSLARSLLRLPVQMDIHSPNALMSILADASLVPTHLGEIAGKRK